MTPPLRVFLCGEGRNELGSRVGHPIYQSSEYPGVIEALLARVRQGGWEIVGALEWRYLPKLRAHGPSPEESEQVARLMVMAQDDYRADVVAYTRDGDDETADRREAHRRGIEEGAKLAPSVKVVGEIAAPSIEGWILALFGDPRTEAMSCTKAATLLKERGIAPKDTATMVRIVEQCADLDRVPGDAVGLCRFRDAARKALAAELAVGE